MGNMSPELQLFFHGKSEVFQAHHMGNMSNFFHGKSEVFQANSMGNMSPVSGPQHGQHESRVAIFAMARVRFNLIIRPTTWAT